MRRRDFMKTPLTIAGAAMLGKAGMMTLLSSSGTAHAAQPRAPSLRRKVVSAFDKEYFYLESPDDERVPSLTPDEDTAAKPYQTEVLPSGEKPLIFYNGVLELCLESGQMPMDPPPDVLFDGDNLVVRERIAKKLEDMNIPNLAIQPAIYKDHKKKWHEDYWFLTFTKTFDCWDREKSRYNPKPRITNGVKEHLVYTFMLNGELLQKTPLRERLLFKMGGSRLSPIFAHKSIVDLFRMRGVNVISVAEKAKEDGILEGE